MFTLIAYFWRSLKKGHFKALLNKYHRQIVQAHKYVFCYCFQSDDSDVESFAKVAGQRTIVTERIVSTTSSNNLLKRFAELDPEDNRA